MMQRSPGGRLVVRKAARGLGLLSLVCLAMSYLVEMNLPFRVPQDAARCLHVYAGALRYDECHLFGREDEAAKGFRDAFYRIAHDSMRVRVGFCFMQDIQWRPSISRQLTNVDSSQFGALTLSSTTVLLPLWLPTLLILMVSALLWRAGRSPEPALSCRSCGYNLTGNVSGVCPECGAPCKTAESGSARKVEGQEGSVGGG